MNNRIRLSISTRLMLLFVLLLLAFTAILLLQFNTMLRRETISNYSKTMQRDAYAIS